ncbi:MAG: hypothetical protein NTX62_00870, partial [Deltaproteobacteria bacterium]|nr:hypothetical protein [Deltaproteobacteria bacterium]
MLKTLCLAILLIIVIAGLWPFNFIPKNEVEWLQDKHGVHFYGQGMIVSADVWGNEQKPLFPDKSITLEIMLRPLLETSNLPGILTFYDGKTPDLMLVGQWRSHLAIRSRTDDPAARKRGKPYQEIGLRNGLLKDQDVFITITSNTEGTAIYLNGKLARSYPRHRLLAGYQGEPARLILGNSPNGHSYWTGNLLGLAIYDRALTPDQVFGGYRAWNGGNPAAVAAKEGCLGSYLFHEKAGTTVHNLANPQFSLAMPTLFTPLQRIILDPPWAWRDFRWSWSLAQDVTINILGFIPFGFFFSILLMRTTRLKRSAIFFIIAAAG